MSVKRVVIVADEYNLGKLTEALIEFGVKGSDIHISCDCVSLELLRKGASCDVPTGSLLISSYKPEATSSRRAKFDAENQVP